MRRFWLVAPLLLAGLAPPAQAAEVRTVDERVCDEYGCNLVPGARYTAAPGETNALVVSGEPGSMAFRDAAGIQPGRGCDAAADGTVVCDAYSAAIEMGDGDDVLRTATHRLGWLLRVDGGAGDDDLAGDAELTGGPGDDSLTGRRLSGDDGSDTLTGTPFDDRLYGGAGADVITALGGYDDVVGGGATDILSGGDGLDVVDYRGHVDAVRVDLAAGSGGAAGENDVLTGFERAQGGSGGDVLLGDDGDNLLYGEDGRDTLIGGRGDDSLQGGLRRDVLDGGPGRDRLDGAHGVDLYSGGEGRDTLFLWGSRARETLDCGPGRDTISWPGLALLLASCEIAGWLPAHPRLGRDGSLIFRITGLRRGWRRQIELRVRGRRRPFSVNRLAGTGRTLRVRMPVPRAVRRLRRRPVPIEIRIDYPGEPGVGLRWVIDLPR
jgi:hypothetical protein